MSGTGQGKINAFDCLLASARRPGAFELPNSASELEYKQKLDDDFVTYLVERICDHRIAKSLIAIKDVIDEEEQCDLKPLLYSPLVDLHDFLQAPSNKISPAPEPEPSIDSYLQKITVYFRMTDLPSDGRRVRSWRSYRSWRDTKEFLIVGLGFKYSDGRETEIGNLRGATSNVSVHLGQIGSVREHIYFVNQITNERGVLHICFHTKCGRQFHFGKGQMHEHDQDCYSDQGRREPVDIPPGHILWSLIWCENSHKLARALSQEPPLRKAPATLPSVTSLALMSRPGAKNELERSHSETMTSYRGRLQRIGSLAQGPLLECYLKGRIHLILEETAISEGKAWNQSPEYCDYIYEFRMRDILDFRGDTEVLQLYDKRDKIIKCTRDRVSKMREELALRYQWEWKAWHMKHKSSHAHSVSHGLLQPDTRLCLTCFSGFFPAHVRNSARCSVPDCFDRFHHWGCSISSCDRCFSFLCQKHQIGHEAFCKKSFRSMCGWRKNETSIDLDFCGQVSEKDDLRTCIQCKTRCCKQCRIDCVGRARSPTWQEMWLEENPYSVTALRRRPRHMTENCRAAWCNRCETKSPSYGYSYGFMRLYCCDDCSELEPPVDEKESSESDYVESSDMEESDDDSFMSTS